MLTWYTAPAVGIPRGGCQMLSSVCPGLATSSVTVLIPVNTGLGSSQGARATASARPARATHDQNTMVNGSKSGNGRQTLLISQVSTAVTPPAAITISGTPIASQRAETAPPALPLPAPRLKKPRPGALRPAASQASASSALTSKMTGSGPATSDQSSGFIAPLPRLPVLLPRQALWH